MYIASMVGKYRQCAQHMADHREHNPLEGCTRVHRKHEA